jgi:radical SAM protein with 4Fe4S-binding SPASM domain
VVGIDPTAVRRAHSNYDVLRWSRGNALGGASRRTVDFRRDARPSASIESGMSVHPRFTKPDDGERNSAIKRKYENLARLREDAARGESRFRGLPAIVSFHTTDICNLRCVMCARSVVDGSLRLDRGALRRVCDDLFPTAFKAMALANLGEPMLADMDLVVENALRHEVKVDLVTNGTLLTGERYREMRVALNRVNISIDSHVPEIYERIRVGARFERLISNLRAVSEERKRAPDGVILSMSAIVMRSNIDTLPDFVAFAAGLGADQVEIQLLRHFGFPVPDEEVMPFEARLQSDRNGGSPAVRGRAEAPPELQRCYELIVERARRERINVNFGDFGAPPVIVRTLVEKATLDLDSTDLCWNVLHNFGLFQTGEVYPCCHPTKHLMGNIHVSAPREVWNSAATQALRRAHFDRRPVAYCSGCSLAPYLEHVGDASGSGLGPAPANADMDPPGPSARSRGVD